LQALWDEHLRHEFGTHNVEDALATMVEDAYVNDIPVMTGGVETSTARVLFQYGIPQIPPDTWANPNLAHVGTGLSMKCWLSSLAIEWTGCYWHCSDS